MENIKDLDFRKFFGERLKELRKEIKDSKGKKMTLEALAEGMSKNYGIDMSNVTYANYERGFRIPDLFILSKIAEYFDVSTDYLLGVTDVRNAKVLQTSIFDKEGKEHTVKVAVDKDSDLAKMPVGEVIELIKKIKNLGIDFNNIK